MRWLAGLLMMACGVVFAESTDALFVAAHDAYKSREEQTLAADVQRLQAGNYVLAPYADYWLLLLHLEQTNTPEVQNFLSHYADLPFSDRVRAEWLKQLGKRQDWAVFFDELPRLQREDAGVSCYALLGRDNQGNVGALQEGKALWLTTAEQPANCEVLYDRMQQQGVLETDDIWARVRLALSQGRISVAKVALQRLPQIDAKSLKLLDKAYENPQRTLEKKTFTTKTRFGRELSLYALDRVSRSQPQLALEHWNAIKDGFNRDEQNYLWGRMAMGAAKRHDPLALDWYERAADAPLDPEQMAWKVRAALRVRNWDAVLTTIVAMPAPIRDESAWRYWRGRALKENGQLVAANALLLPLARERTTYYGLLAEEELGEVIGSPPRSYKATEEEVRAVQNLPGIQRALELSRFDMRWESKSEWAWAIRTFDDRQLIAASELAFRQEWYDLAIITAEKTSLMHDFTLRYPTPYRDMMRNYVRDNSLDEDWVYGLIRQESRFVSYARSGAGASGLMQLMPATARWIAKRVGVRDYHPGMINRLDTNLQFGTYYLRYILDKMDGQPLLATAAYNAGPLRAKRWGDSQNMEGAIYAESIPFGETRGYVQKVMSNAYFYANRLGIKLKTLKQRLGQVTGEGGILPQGDYQAGGGREQP